MEISATVQTFPLRAQSPRWKMRGYISEPTSSENTFEEIFYCAKYLRAMLLITYLFLYKYHCTDSTLTNMNEWIHEETRVMCYIPHQKSKVQLLLFQKSTVYLRHISVVPGICSMGWNIHHSASLWKRNSQLFHIDWIWSVSVPTAVCFDCQSVTQQSREFSCKTTAFITTHWLVRDTLVTSASLPQLGMWNNIIQQFNVMPLFCMALL